MSNEGHSTLLSALLSTPLNSSCQVLFDLVEAAEMHRAGSLFSLGIKK